MKTLEKINVLTFKVRKGMIPVFVIKLMLFMSIFIVQSCQTDNDIITNNEERFSLKEFTTEHISINQNILELLKNEDKFNSNVLLINLNEVNNEEEFKQALRTANIKEYDEFLDLFKEIRSNSERFINANQEFYNLSEGEREIKFKNEVDKLLTVNEEQTSYRLSCAGIRGRAENRCLRTYVISNGGSVEAGLLSGEIGLLIGWGVSSAIFVNCMSEATSDYNECITNE